MTHVSEPTKPGWFKREKEFLVRLANHGAVALTVIAISLGVGMVGYNHFDGKGWINAYLSAAMILGGMGPVKSDVQGNEAIFAATYALYAGLVFVAVMGIIITPVVHRVLKNFHSERQGSAVSSPPTSVQEGTLQHSRVHISQLLPTDRTPFDNPQTYPVPRRRP